MESENQVPVAGEGGAELPPRVANAGFDSAGHAALEAVDGRTAGLTEIIAGHAGEPQGLDLGAAEAGEQPAATVEPSAALEAELGLLRVRVAQMEVEERARAAELHRLQVLDAVRAAAVRQGVDLEERALADAYELHLLEGVTSGEDGALQGVETALQNLLEQRPHFARAARPHRPIARDIDATARSASQGALETPEARRAAARLLRGF